MLTSDGCEPGDDPVSGENGMERSADALLKSGAEAESEGAFSSYRFLYGGAALGLSASATPTPTSLCVNFIDPSSELCCPVHLDGDAVAGNAARAWLKAALDGAAAARESEVTRLEGLGALDPLEHDYNRRFLFSQERAVEESIVFRRALEHGFSGPVALRELGWSAHRMARAADAVNHDFKRGCLLIETPRRFILEPYGDGLAPRATGKPDAVFPRWVPFDSRAVYCERSGLYYIVALDFKGGCTALSLYSLDPDACELRDVASTVDADCPAMRRNTDAALNAVLARSRASSNSQRFLADTEFAAAGAVEMPHDFRVSYCNALDRMAAAFTSRDADGNPMLFLYTFKPDPEAFADSFKAALYTLT